MLTGYLFTILAVIFWGASFIGTKIAYQTFTPLFLCILRFAIAAVLLFLLRQIRRDTAVPDRRNMLRILISSLVGVSLYYACENTALNMTTAASASLIAGSYPAITALTGLVFFHEHYGRKRIFGIVLAIAGVVILNGQTTSDAASNALLGNLILIFDGFLWAFYNYIIPEISPDLSALTVTYYQTLFGVVFLLPAAFFGQRVIGPVTGQTILAVLFLAVVCSVLAYMMYNYGLRIISAGAAASIMNLMPVAGIVLSALILHEAVTLHHLIGGAVILTGVTISSAKQ